MKIRTSTRHTHVLSVDDNDFELEYEPSYEGHVLTHIEGDKAVIAYLVHDNDYRDVDDLIGDCMGKLISFHRHAPNHEEGLAALGNDRYGEMNLNAVWERHGDEAIRRYIECCVHDAQQTPDGLLELAEALEKYHDNDCDQSTEEFVRESLLDDANHVSGWGYVWNDACMQDVLTKMWGEDEYFPGDLDAQVLSCYSHSGEIWSLSGGGMQCRWDTCNTAGVWVPDKCLRECLDSTAPRAAWAYVEETGYCKGRKLKYQLKYVGWLENDTHGTDTVIETSDDYGDLADKAHAYAASMPAPTANQIKYGRRVQAREYCRQFLDQYNDIINGNIYGCVVESFTNEDDEWVRAEDFDSCWGFVGDEHAMESLESDFFKLALRDLHATPA